MPCPVLLIEEYGHSSKRRQVKKILRTIHLWLGLSTGLVVFLIALTGCIYAFQVELQNGTQPYRFVKTENKPLRAPSDLAAQAGKELPGKQIHSIEYGNSEAAVRVSFYSNDPAYYYMVYVNPYDGTVLKVKDMDLDFFRIVLMGHYYLWLPPAIGKPLVASATLVFLAMLITGIILWWPKNKSAAKQRFRIQWSGSWKRKNYDLHSVFGFYASWVAVFLAITGLVWGFEWFAAGVYWSASGGRSLVPYTETFSDTSVGLPAKAAAMDIVWDNIRKENPDAETIEIHVPERNASVIIVSANPDATVLWKTDHRYFDQYSLKELSVSHMYGRYRKEMPVADKLLRMNYDLHVGAVLGLPGKILAFFASLICASLPVTGFLLWWGRRNKTKKE